MGRQLSVFRGQTLHVHSRKIIHFHLQATGNFFFCPLQKPKEKTGIDITQCVFYSGNMNTEPNYPEKTAKQTRKISHLTENGSPKKSYDYRKIYPYLPHFSSCCGNLPQHLHAHRAARIAQLQNRMVRVVGIGLRQGKPCPAVGHVDAHVRADVISRAEALACRISSQLRALEALDGRWSRESADIASKGNDIYALRRARAALLLAVRAEEGIEHRGHALRACRALQARIARDVVFVE